MDKDLKNKTFPELEELVVSNTIQLNDTASKSSKIRVLSIAELFSEAIKRINNNDSVSSLFI